MSLETMNTHTTTKAKLRIFSTGDCEGLGELRQALERHGEIELVGATTSVAEAASTLRGGHLNVVIHATRSPTLPRAELPTIREHTAAPVVLLASGESSTLLEEALEADVADVLLLPQMTDNLVFAIRKASHTGGRRAGVSHAKRGRIVTVFSPKGGTGKTVIATNTAASTAKHEGKRALLVDLDL